MSKSVLYMINKILFTIVVVVPGELFDKTSKNFETFEGSELGPPIMYGGALLSIRNSQGISRACAREA